MNHVFPDKKIILGRTDGEESLKFGYVGVETSMHLLTKNEEVIQRPSAFSWPWNFLLVDFKTPLIKLITAN